MELIETREGSVTVVKPTGPLVQADADRFGAYVAGVMERSAGRLLVDASGMPYADSKGLEALLGASEATGAAGRALGLCGATETLREALELTGLVNHFEFFADVQTGVRSFL